MNQILTYTHYTSVLTLILN